jgi:hypothetical protein
MSLNFGLVKLSEATLIILVRDTHLQCECNQQTSRSRQKMVIYLYVRSFEISAENRLQYGDGHLNRFIVGNRSAGFQFLF